MPCQCSPFSLHLTNVYKVCCNEFHQSFASHATDQSFIIIFESEQQSNKKRHHNRKVLACYWYTSFIRAVSHFGIIPNPGFERSRTKNRFVWDENYVENDIVLWNCEFVSLKNIEFQRMSLKLCHLYFLIPSSNQNQRRKSSESSGKYSRVWKNSLTLRNWTYQNTLTEKSVLFIRKMIYYYHLALSSKHSSEWAGICFAHHSDEMRHFHSQLGFP